MRVASTEFSQIGYVHDDKSPGLWQVPWESSTCFRTTACMEAKTSCLHPCLGTATLHYEPSDPKLEIYHGGSGSQKDK